MSPDTLTINQFSLVISQAAAPAFLLGAVASFLSVLTSYLHRIIDRSRAINAIPDEDATSAHLKATLPQLKILGDPRRSDNLLGDRKRHRHVLCHDRRFCKCVLRRRA